MVLGESKRDDRREKRKIIEKKKGKINENDKKLNGRTKNVQIKYLGKQK